MAVEEPKRSVYFLVKVFVVFHMVMILSWSAPKAPPAILNGSVPPTPQNVASRWTDFLLAENDKFRFLTPFKYYLLTTGTWQYWDMFAPNPANTDFWWDAVVTYKNGDQKVAVYPRMKDLSISEKYIKERYRKYLERMNNDSTDSWKRPTFAQRMALLAYKDPENPPVRVVLRRHFKQMLGMDKPVPKDYSVFEVFEYVVDQEKLKKDAGR